MRRDIKISESGRRRGMVMVYVVIAVPVLLGICSLAVDLGRVQTAKTELRRAADASARAAVANLSTSSTAAKTAAVNMALLEKVDGTNLVLVQSTDTAVGWWNTSTRVFATNANPMNAVAPNMPAVKITARRTAATGTGVKLLFAQVIGAQTCDIVATSIAALNMQTVVITVNSTNNPWLAGQTTTGVKASEPDPLYPSSAHQWKYDLSGPVGGHASSGELYASPQPASGSGGITLTPGATIQVSSVSGTTSNDSGPPSYSADGFSGGSQSIYSDDAATDTGEPGYTGQSNGGVSGSEHGIANINSPINSLNALFLDGNVPDTEGTAPPGLDFSTSSEQSYNSISPLTRQPFFVGDGQSGGKQQNIVVPANATRIYFGTMDGHEWSNNQGSFTLTVIQSYISVVQ